MAIFFFYGTTHSQEKGNARKNGTISFITPQNIYVRFENTGGITAGDTIYIERQGRVLPAVITKYLSSLSCSGPKIGNSELKTGDIAFAFVKAETQKENHSVAGQAKDTTLAQQISPTATQGQSQTVIPRVYGALSANSYSNFSNYTNSSDIQRWDYSFHMNADNINGSQFYFSNYMDFNYLSGQWTLVQSNIFNSLKIYDLAFGYKSSYLNGWLGRHINNEIAGIGPIDGLQAEQRFGDFGVGGVLGSRPDFYNMSFNPKLPEFGAYIDRNDTLNDGFMNNTLGIFQQNNDLNTDRRFIYFQHNSNPVRAFSFFATAQIDIFKIYNGTPTNTFSLTNLYLSTQYAPINILTLNISYSAQRNIIYYQTFSSTIDSFLLSQNQLRQSVMAGIYLRPWNSTFINLNGGYSIQQGDVAPSRNANATITQSNIPLLLITASVTYSQLVSSFVNGSIYGVALTKYLDFSSASVEIGYTRLNYSFGAGIASLIQNQATAQISMRVFSQLFFNLYYEGFFYHQTTYGTLAGGFNVRF